MTGSFDDWSRPVPLTRDGDGSSGTWSADVPGVRPGAEYRFTVHTPDGDLSRLDPYARQVTNSVGNGVVYDPTAFDWGDTAFAARRLERPGHLRDAHRHVRRPGASTPGNFDRAIRRLPYLRELGISAIQVMPPFEFAGDVSWGYNPAHVFAIESSYGGPGRLQALHPGGPRARHRGDRRRRLQPPRARATSTCGASTAGPRATGAASTSTTTTGPSRPGATPGPTTAAARCAPSCATAP